MYFDRFDICEAYALMEAFYNVGGVLWERPSNARRMESTSCQLARIGFKPAPAFGYIHTLSENGRAIFRMLEHRYGFAGGPAASYIEEHQR